MAGVDGQYRSAPQNRQGGTGEKPPLNIHIDIVIVRILCDFEFELSGGKCSLMYSIKQFFNGLSPYLFLIMKI